MMHLFRARIFLIISVALTFSGVSWAQNTPIRIGVITDMSGNFSAHNGPGTVAAVELAVKDFGGQVLGQPIQVISADYQAKPDIASGKIREWLDVGNVDVVITGADSASDLAMQTIAADKKKPILITASAATAIVNENCTPYSIQYNISTYALSASTARALVAQGGDTWFFITVDQAFGKAVEADSRKVVEAAGGKVLGFVRHPLNTADFASFLLQAQASKAKIIALANSGKDTQTALLQGSEFGIRGSQSLVPLLMYITDLKGLGLNVTQGMKFAESFYWDRNDESRAWSQRFFAVHKGMPSMNHAAAYSSTLHYLKAVQAAKTATAEPVLEQMRNTPVNDVFAKNGKIRIDGSMVHDMYLAVAKAPSESTGPWDLEKITGVVPGEQAFKPLSESTCRLVKK